MSSPDKFALPELPSKDNKDQLTPQKPFDPIEQRLE
jgi:hypothetical protein